MRHECLRLNHFRTRLLRLRFHLLLGRHRHRTTLLGFRLRDILIRFGLVHLQLRTYILTYVYIRDIDGEDLECSTVIEAFGKH